MASVHGHRSSGAQKLPPIPCMMDSSRGNGEEAEGFLFVCLARVGCARVRPGSGRRRRPWSAPWRCSSGDELAMRGGRENASRHGEACGRVDSLALPMVAAKKSQSERCDGALLLQVLRRRRRVARARGRGGAGGRDARVGHHGCMRSVQEEPGCLGVRARVGGAESNPTRVRSRGGDGGLPGRLVLGCGQGEEKGKKEEKEIKRNIKEF